MRADNIRVRIDRRFSDVEKSEAIEYPIIFSKGETDHSRGAGMRIKETIMSLKAE